MNARASNTTLQVGDTVESLGLDCIAVGQRRVVESDGETGALFVRCGCGRHFLTDDLAKFSVAELSPAPAEVAA